MRRPGWLRALGILLLRPQLRERGRNAQALTGLGQGLRQLNVDKNTGLAMVESSAGLPGGTAYIVSLLDTL